jgi:uncharacterized protein (TIGR02996 family)
MTDGYALLRAIEANPDEDTPRLAYADWLQEHDQPERAELIRLQCEIARRSDRAVPEGERAERYAQIGEWKKRVEELLAAHGKAWRNQIPGQQFNEHFECGFLDPVHMPALAFSRSSEQLVAVAPIHHIHLFKARLAPDRLAACSILRFVRHLDLTHNVMQNAHITALAKSSHFENLRILDASENRIGVAGCVGLREGTFPALRHLALSHNPIKDRGLAAIRSASWFSQLEGLYISRCDITDAGVIALASDSATSGLRTLSVDNSACGEAAARAILDSPHLLGLEQLRFPLYHLTPDMRAKLQARFRGGLNPSWEPLRWTKSATDSS